MVGTMANLSAISVSSSLSYSANKVSAKLSTTFSADQAGNFFESGIQSVGTTEESLDKGDVVTIGKIAVRNMDATNYIQVGHLTGSYSIKLNPGEGFAGLTWGGSSVFVKANTAACNVEYLIVEA